MKPRSNQGSWRAGSKGEQTRSADDTPGAPPLQAEPFHTTRLPKDPVGPPVSPRPIEPTRPAPRPVVQTASESRPVPPAKTKAGGDTNVTINISMPKLPKPNVADWPWKKIRRYAIIVLALIVVSIVLRLIIVTAIEQHKINEAKNRLDTVQPTKTAPSFTPLTPKGKTASVAKKAGFDGVRDSYSYNDVYKGGEIIVSQQPLATGAAAADVAAKAAKSLGANTPLALNNGAGYMADAKSGGQTVVLGRGNVLLFVQSAVVHSAADWQSYLDNLVTT